MNHQGHTIAVDLAGEVTVSMIRLWNYNKSRTHSTRGVRRVRIALDDQVGR
jgi:protein JBTS26